MAHGKKKVILTGYRATGKTTVGRLLAARLGVAFLDTDAEIEERENRSIPEMVKKDGWEYFRGRERELLHELVARKDGVIASGGGAIIHEEAWRELMKTGLVVWLSTDIVTICQRLAADEKKNSGQRPTLTGKEITTEVAEVLALREPLYRKGSHLVIDSAGNTPAAIVDKILVVLEEYPTAPSW